MRGPESWEEVGKSQYCHRRSQDRGGSAEMVNISSSSSEPHCTLPERRLLQFPQEIYQRSTLSEMLH